MTDQEQPEFGWCVLELMGHRKLAGYVTERGPLYRIDVYLDVSEDGGIHATQFYAPAAVYCITPVTQEVAVGLAQRYQPEPVSRWELPAPKEPQTVPDAEVEDDPEYDWDH